MPAKAKAKAAGKRAAQPMAASLAGDIEGEQELDYKSVHVDKELKYGQVCWSFFSCCLCVAFGCLLPLLA